MPLDISHIADELIEIITTFQTQFYNLDRNESQLLELSALIFTAEYYKECGYLVTPKNLTKDSNEYYIKIRANARPFKYSFFEVDNGSARFEIHGNLQVAGCFDKNGIYAVDVGIIKQGSLPFTLKEQKKWKAVSNIQLITFMEVKKLVIYPMLLAQFVGIVHEIKFEFLTGRLPRNFRKNMHMCPSLVAIGYLSGTSSKIIEGFKRRKYRIRIIPNFNREVSLLRRDGIIQDLKNYVA